jgi:phage gp36-like protein
MPYCTVADLVGIFGQDDIAALTNRQDTQATTVDDAIALQAIVQAEAEINVYLEGRYPLPLASTPLILTQVTADIARFYLHTRIDEEHPVAQRYRQRVKLLEGIAAGRLSLGLDAANKVATPADTVQIAPGRNDFGGRNW